MGRERANWRIEMPVHLLEFRVHRGLDCSAFGVTISVSTIVSHGRPSSRFRSWGRLGVPKEILAYLSIDHKS